VQAHWSKGGDLDREVSGDDHGETTASDGGADPEAHRSYMPASSPTNTVPHRRRPEGRADVGEGRGGRSREGIHSDEGALAEEGGCGRGRVCRTPKLVARKDKDRARAREFIQDERQERERESALIRGNAFVARKKRDAEFTGDGREEGSTRGDTCVARNKEGQALEQGDKRAHSLNTTRVRGPGRDGEAGGEKEEKENDKQEEFRSIQRETTCGGMLAGGQERLAGVHGRDENGFGEAGVRNAFTARGQREVESGGGWECCAGVALGDGKEGDEMAVEGGRQDFDGDGLKACGGSGAGEERGVERVIGGRDKDSDVGSLKGIGYSIDCEVVGGREVVGRREDQDAGEGTGAGGTGKASRRGGELVVEGAVVGEGEGGIGICFQLGTDGRLFVKALAPHGPAHAEVC
jgi:hypothetical protein